MKALRRLLQESTNLYLTLDRKLTEFAGRADDFTAENVRLFQDEVASLEEQISQIDSRIAPIIEGSEESQLRDLLEMEKRREAMAKVQEHNRLLSQKIRGIMSIISHELTRTRGGKHAVSGYRGGNDRKGSIVSGNY